MSSSPGPTVIDRDAENAGATAEPERGLSFSRRWFLKLSIAGGAVSLSQFAGAQTIPVMFWLATRSSAGAGAICSSPIADGPIGGSP